MHTDAEVVGFFHRHVVSLIFTFQKGNEIHHLAVTTFVLSVSDHWFLITAGHCIRKIEERIELGYELIRCQLIDFLGSGATHFESIPFLYKNSHPKCLSDDYAFDYGVITLSKYYRQLLESNNIQALNEETWKKQPLNVEFYELLGIPSELVTVDIAHIEIGSMLYKVEPIDKKPAGFSDVDIPLFYGRIVLGDKVNSIQGMSGGPIFAFQHNEIGEVRYFLIALQSRWLPESCFIAACPTKLLGHFLEYEIGKAT